MNSKVTALAARVILQSSTTVPADAALRKILRAERGLTSDRSAEVARAVFAYFRWQRWLPPGDTLSSRVEQAVGLARRFAERPDSFADSELIENAVPSWISAELTITSAWVRALQKEPILWLRARSGQAASLAEHLGDCRGFQRGTDALEYHGTKDLFHTPEFHAGCFELQDLSSQAVGLICAPAAGHKWWDSCAGEGGKTLHLSDLMGNQGLIWATDRAAWRIEKLRLRAARAGVFNYRGKVWDGSSRLPVKTLFDGVLVDAPCSGVGTWGRNPHARWTAAPRDLLELSQLQALLLAHAAKAVKPGGRLVYAVCTLTRSETVDVVSKFNTERTDFEPVQITSPLGGGKSVAYVSICPEDFGSNGMFIAAWRKRDG